MARKWFMWIGSAIAAVTVALSTTLVLAQTPAAGQREMAEHKQKMAEQKVMMAKMAAADQTLTDLVAKMNAAKGEEKVAAVAAVLNELVAQRKQMHESCGTMKTATEPAKPAAGDEHAGHHPAQ